MPKPATRAPKGRVPGEYTPAQARSLFDEAARRHLGVDGDEFLRRWDAGEYADDPDRAEVIEVAMLIPLVR